MKGLDFFVDFASTGHIEGIGLGSSLEEWDRSVGVDYVDDSKKKQLSRDYGLVELTFWRSEEAWQCTNISIQTHRLWWDSSQGPAKLLKKYGDFPRSVLFEELREKLDPLDRAPNLIEDQKKSDYTRYYIPESKVLIIILSSPVPKNLDDMPRGMIWSMNLSVNSEVWIKPFQ